MTESVRIIFVPGMKPKPPERIHRQVLGRCMRAGLERVDPGAAAPLRDGARCLTAAAWNHAFYRRHRNIELDKRSIERILEESEPSNRDIVDIEAFARRKTRILLRMGHAAPLFSSLFARRSMRLTVTETHRYLMNWGGIARGVRDIVRSALLDAWSAGEQVLLIGHSLGSVIAYDTLWELSHGERRENGRVSLFMTLGSPLASPMILRGVQGARLSGRKRFPEIVDRWQNFSARGEITALHPAFLHTTHPTICTAKEKRRNDETYNTVETPFSDVERNCWGNGAGRGLCPWRRGRNGAERWGRVRHNAGDGDAIDPRVAGCGHAGESTSPQRLDNGSARSAGGSAPFSGTGTY